MDSDEVLITCIFQYVKNAIFVCHQGINLKKFKLSKSNKRNLRINGDLNLIKDSELLKDQKIQSFSRIL